MFDGMVLWIQITSNNQWQRRNPQFYVYSWKCGDREPLKQERFLENIKGKLCADKGYIGQALFENLFLNGIQLVTKVKNKMKNSLMSIADKILLRKRALIETVNDELKNIAQIEHSRHRSFNNFIANAISAIAAYCFFDKKPAIDIEFIKERQLTLFWVISNWRYTKINMAHCLFSILHNEYCFYKSSCNKNEKALSLFPISKLGLSFDLMSSICKYLIINQYDKKSQTCG